MADSERQGGRRMKAESPRGRARFLARQVPRQAKRRAARVVRRLRSGRPLATAVVLLSGPEDAARATLDSVRDQPVAALEILAVVMDERLDGLAASAVAEDWRVRRLTSVGDDRAAARRVGSAAACTPALIFLSPRQVLVPGAVERLLAESSEGTVLVLGGVDGAPAPWARTPLLGRLLVPRELWTAAHDDGEPDGQTVAVSLMSTGAVEVDAAVLGDRHVPRAKLFERGVDPMPALTARVAADCAMLERLAGVDGLLRAARATGALVRDLPTFVFEAERADESTWQLLVGHASRLMLEAGAAGVRELGVEERVATWLTAEGRREALVEFVAARRFAGGHFATRVVEGQVLALFEALPDDVPAEIVLLSDAESGLRAQLRRSRVRDGALEVEVFAGIRMADQGTDVLDVTASLVSGADRLELSVEVGADMAVTRWMGEPHQYHDFGVLTCRTSLDLLTPGSWHLDLDVHCGGVRRTGLVSELDPHGSAAQELRLEDRSLRWTRRSDAVQLTVTEPPAPPPDPGTIVVQDTSFGPRRLVLSFEASESARASLVAPGQVITGAREGSEWTFELETDPWSLGMMPAPSASYRLVVTEDGVERPVTAARRVVDLLPRVDQDDGHRKALWGGPRGGLTLRLDPPLAEEVAGPWAQRRLQRRHATIEGPVDPRLVYFQSFLGQSPTDHPAAIQTELHRSLGERGISGVRTLWAVADASVRVPEGAEPVLMRSQEWYDALARSAWVVTNIELEPWFTRREGQEVLETYHGYPSKAMGLSQWRSRGLTPSHQRQMLQRTSGTWNNLLTPIPEMDHYYRENYEFEGRILSLGYPRDDALVSPTRDEQRRAVRRRLGIGENQSAVLYAPTWRDDLATNFRRAEALLHLDVDEAAAALGPDYVILLRGHRFHAASAGGAQVLDVTTYPEINDLILAADAAVLDYSSLRFDFALTGRPMVFLVPDLDSYTRQTRGFLYDFADSAPGPFLDTTSEVVEALSDLPALRTRWTAQIEAHNSSYNRLADGDAARRVVGEFFAPLLGC